MLMNEPNINMEYDFAVSLPKLYAAAHSEGFTDFVQFNNLAHTLYPDQQCETASLIAVKMISERAESGPDEWAGVCHNHETMFDYDPRKVDDPREEVDD